MAHTEAGTTADAPPKDRPTRTPGSGPIRRRRLSDAQLAWLLLVPALVVLVTFTHYPVVSAAWASVHDAAGDPTVANYQRMLDDPVFWRVLRNNAWFALGTVPTSMALGLAMAYWVNQRFRGRGVLRLAYFTPAILPMVAIASIWLFFYSPGIGPVSQLVTALGFEDRNWLGDRTTVLPAIIITNIWKEAGFLMIFFLAGLQNIPPELDEAAQIEGASRWYRFRRVTLPLLAPTTVFVLIIAFTNAFKTVDFLFIMTAGGPNNASNLLLYYIYEVAFTFWNRPYAATLTVVLVTVLLAASLAQLRLFDRRVHYR